MGQHAASPCASGACRTEGAIFDYKAQASGVTLNSPADTLATTSGKLVGTTYDTKGGPSWPPLLYLLDSVGRRVGI